MAEKKMITVDANEAAASVAHRVSEVIAIYPITPSSTMGEFADEWSARGQRNIWGTIPFVQEMQSEGGAAGAVHGAIQAGALSTTFTASQGLLLMIPNMYKIAGELTPFVMHVSARTLATHALSIFGDHGDVMGCRQTGFAMLCSNTVQEAHDLAAIAHAATLKSRVPFLHFFDGWRTSTEVARMALLGDEDLRQMIDEDLVKAHRDRALSPDHPLLRGTAQNPDTFFQQREACSPYFDAAPAIVQQYMDRFAKVTGRQYRLFEYEGHPQAEKVIILMGSGCETVGEYVELGRRPGPEGRHAEGAALPAVQHEGLPGCDAEGRQGGRGAGPDEGIRFGGRAAVPGCDHGRGRGAQRGDQPVCRGAEDRGRAVRPVQQGIHPGDGQGGLRERGGSQAEEPLYGRDQR